MKQQFGDDVQIIGVPGLSDNVGSMLRFVDDTGSSGIPHVLDSSGELWDRFGVTEQRTYVFVNDDGQQRIGSYGSLAADVEDLLAR